MIVTRFAPSPNGSLHLGHAYAAIVAHDLARQRDGAFRLRIEDIDAGRSRPELINEFLDELAWLGLRWDGELVLQSTRLDAYRAAGERLKEMGLLYPCTCTRAEIAAAATRTGPDGPLYPGTCRRRPPSDEGQAAWRLDMSRATALAGSLTWFDEIAGEQVADPARFGDVVLLRKEAPASYHLAATLDDAADGITLVTRGIDLFAASHLHRLLQALLGLPVPRWHHHPLLLDDHGRKLAKRRGTTGLSALRLAGEDGPGLADSLRSGRFGTGIRLSEGLDWLP
ncbi:tRNA glutamyl-Q(34) synthetase GluQRS [Novosphingobium tardum]|uniref:tRNA glutamyl-Q(34) synthetase GluQRS n=1 Tax=Novosphingobium tardum TaxID=1538021 RepID=A0ABV8RL70_9SPHN